MVRRLLLGWHYQRKPKVVDVQSSLSTLLGVFFVSTNRNSWCSSCKNIHWLVVYQNPSEKWWSKSVSFFPTEWKVIIHSCSSHHQPGIIIIGFFIWQVLDHWLIHWKMWCPNSKLIIFTKKQVEEVEVWAACGAPHQRGTFLVDVGVRRSIALLRAEDVLHRLCVR